MSHLESWRARRDAMLRTLDLDAARETAVAVAGYAPDDATLLASLHKARHANLGMPIDLRIASLEWLVAHGMGPMA